MLEDGVTARLECEDGKLAGWNRGRFGNFGAISELSCLSILRRSEDCDDEGFPLGVLPPLGGRR